MRLSRFLTEHLDSILAEWDAFARSIDPHLERSDLVLRDHAREMLEAVAADIETAQTDCEQRRKSEGRSDDTDRTSAASVHGALRHENDFSLLQVSAEFRALRATVLRLWLPHVRVVGEGTVQEIIRFNEAIDQALAESIVAYVRESDQARQLLLAVLGHDLRSPLTHMALAGDMLSMKMLPAERVHSLGGSVRRAARLMQAMVDDLMGYTRTQLGRGIPLQRVECDLRDVLNGVLDDARATHPQVRYELDAEGVLDGCYDATRLHQMFLNLLGNAGQHGAKGHPVRVVARGREDRLEVRVHNHGPVIAGEDLEAIFKPLVQLSADRQGEGDARSRTSLGLGLFIVREIAQGHGGEVTVASDAVEGTTFTVVLPRDTECMPDAADSRVPESADPAR